MDTLTFSWEAVKQQDMVEYLEKLGYAPMKIHGSNYWYLSPFRNEKEPSFKIDGKQNCWYDFGEGIGGNLVDFLLKFYNCSIKELYRRINSEDICNSPKQSATINRDVPSSSICKIEIKDILNITNPALVNYLQVRCIPLDIARQFCREVHYTLYNKNYFAIGFQNDLGGYELRNAYFKGSASPKTTTFFNNHSDTTCVFEGFFNFLSYRTIFSNQQHNPANFLVLNSLSFFHKRKDFLSRFDQIQLYLDNDDSGKKATQKAIQWSTKFRDESNLYTGYKDLNEWHRHIGKAPGLLQPVTP